MRNITCIKLLTFLAVAFFISSGCTSVNNARHSIDQKEAEAITKACFDYVEGFFEGSVERVSNGCHQELQKRRIRDNALYTTTREKLLEGVAKNKKKPDNLEITVDIYDVYGTIASAVIYSFYVDYVQLAKIEGRWQVVNVLWDYKSIK
ncbi:MAG: nuclear transport factor 2 family protein [Spirochaetales bacterium]|nr:nuclear transport factor 2 family protein [Spirochaetales bacterium]